MAVYKPNVRQYSADGSPADRKRVDIVPNAACETAGTRFSMSTGGRGTGESSALSHRGLIPSKKFSGLEGYC